MARFEIRKNRQGEFPWQLRARGEVIARSRRAYETKRLCRRSIAAVKALASRPPDRHFDIHKDEQGRFQWRLRLKRGVFAVSPREGYGTRRACTRAIEEVRRVAPEAPVKDLTQPDPPPNRPPEACFALTPEGGQAPLQVFLDASCSTDPDGSIVRYEWDFGDGETVATQDPNAEHTYAEPGTYALTLTVTDDDGDPGSVGKIVEVSEKVVLPAPKGLTAAPGNGQIVLSWEAVEGAASYNLYWSTSPDVSKQNGTRIQGVSSPFPHTGLTNGTAYYYVATAVDGAGQESAESGTASAVPSADNVGPTACFTFTQDAQDPLKVLFDASCSTDPDGTIASYEWDFGDGQSGSGITAEHTYAEEGTYPVKLEVTDDYGATDSTSRPVSVFEVSVPPLDQTAATDFASATRFLYEGDNPVQTGVEPGTIKFEQAAVLRGQVLSKDGSPLRDVIVTVLDHREYGQTLSRRNGMFDMAVNGGGPLTVCYDKERYLHSQWQVDVPRQDYVRVPDAVLLEPDAKVTTVDLSSSEPPPPVQGTPSEDENGTRQATLIFPQGTKAEMRFPNDPPQELTTLNVRATEFTVGEKGPDAMPAELPPASFYTYAVELSVDEALDAKANEVVFDKDVPFYVENFLGFDVGMAVPVGYYDRLEGRWIASENGRVIEIVGLTDGKADVDTAGDGLADTDDRLAALGIDEAERRRLADLYAPGQSLWRVLMRHFTTYDCNWPWRQPRNATLPGQPNPALASYAPANQCKVYGSTIGTLSQTLGEAVDVVGTPFRLHYRSDRAPGTKAAYTLRIPLSGPSIPDSLKRIDLQVLVAGQTHESSFPASTGQSTDFTWDGKDAYGRTVQGAQPVTVRIGYAYDAVYGTPAELEQSFAVYGDALTQVPARQEVILWQQWQGGIGAWDARAQGVGGWSLDVHHAYDPASRVVYLGDGGQRGSTSPFQITIDTVAGGGDPPPDTVGDGGPATEAKLRFPRGVAVSPDGSLYVADQAHSLIRRVGTDGIITTVAGGGDPPPGSVGDGGPATEADLSSPGDVEVAPDGSLYIAEAGNERIRRVGTDGIITTVAGGGDPPPGSNGDGGPATAASLSNPQGVAVAPDGSFYMSDWDGYLVRRVGTDGIITTVAGGGDPPDGLGDNGPATQARLRMPTGVELAPDGSLYIADTGPDRIRRVGTDGTITTVAGGGSVGDGGPATQADLSWPQDVALGPDGSLYIADEENNRVRRVGTDGIITTAAGSGNSFPTGPTGDGGPPTQADLYDLKGVAVGPDGSIYISDTYHDRIRRVAPPVPGFALDDVFVANEDGSEVYAFRGTSGRHLKTLDALTGAVRYEFGYDDAGLLETVTDADGKVTRIERDTNGNFTIVAPFGQQTKLKVNTDGYLEKITNPAGEATQFSYYPGGLLHTLTDPRGVTDPQNHTYTFEYDELGRLKLDKDPADGFSALARTENGRGYKVTLLTAEGRESSYQVERLPTGEERLFNACCGGTQKTVVHTGTDGTETVTKPDGTQFKVVRGPDPRWGMQAPLAQAINVTTPDQRKLAISTDRKATLANPSNPFSVTSITDSTTVNGRPYTRTYQVSPDTATRTITDETPEGRRTVRTLDERGRVVKVQVGDLEPVHYGYDDKGRLETITQGTQLNPRSFTLTYYGDNGYLETITYPLHYTTSFGYDQAGRVKTMTRPDGKQIGYSYDANGNLGSLTPPGRPAHSFPDYTPVNLISKYNPPDVGGMPDEISYIYNKVRQLRRITGPDGMTAEAVYDPPSGRLDNLTLPNGQVDYTYYPTSGNLWTITTPDGTGLSREYDGTLLTSETWSGAITGTVGHTYDNDLRVDSQSINGAHIVGYTYDDDDLLTGTGKLVLHRDPEKGRRAGLLTGTTLGNLTDTLDYDDFGGLKGHSAAHAGTVIYSAKYTLRDKLGRIKEKTETLDGQTHAYVYTYDRAGRLEDVTKNGTRIAHYEYDYNGNRLSYTTEDGTVFGGSYDAQDRLEQYGSTTYTYTVRGALESKTTANQRTVYEYDVLGNLKAVTLSDSHQTKKTEYVVDGTNRRIGKKVNGTLVQGFLYEGLLRPVAELNGSGDVVSRFVYATKANVPDYMEKGDKTYRIITDPVGSVRLVVDASTGEVAQRIGYDEFGKVLYDTNPGFQPFGFAGGLYDPETKLIRFGARDYDAEVGRWTAKDPIGFAGMTSNLYEYVRSDPVNLIDPYGLGNWKWYIKNLWQRSRKWIVVAATGLELVLTGGKSKLGNELRRLEKVEETNRQLNRQNQRRRRRPRGGADPDGPDDTELLSCPANDLSFDDEDPLGDIDERDIMEFLNPIPYLSLEELEYIGSSILPGPPPPGGLY